MHPSHDVRSVPFISQKHKGAPKASPDIGCGVACLAMLLAEYQGRWPRRVPSYKRLWKDLRVDVAPAKKGERKEEGKGAYPDDVERVLRGLNIPFVPTTDKADAEDLLGRVADGPVMVGMGGKAWGACGHWIVLVRVTLGGIEYYDPLLKHVKRKTLTVHRFSCDWDGSSFQLTPPV